MNRRTWMLTWMALALILGTGALLSRQSRMQRLGEPGVKVVAKTIYDSSGKVAGTNSVPLPEQVLDYTSEAVPIDPLVLGWLPPDTTYAQRLYRSTGGFEMLVNVVLMGSDRTSIHKPEYCLVGAGWRNNQFETATILVEEPHPYELPVMKVTSTRQVALPGGETVRRRGIFVFWFVADDELTASHGQRMWSMARNLIWNGVLERWAYVSAFSICLPGQEAATFERMKPVIAAMVPRFQRATGPARAAAP